MNALETLAETKRRRPWSSRSLPTESTTATETFPGLRRAYRHARRIALPLGTTLPLPWMVALRTTAGPGAIDPEVPGARSQRPAAAAAGPSPEREPLSAIAPASRARTTAATSAVTARRSRGLVRGAFTGGLPDGE